MSSEGANKSNVDENDASDQNTTVGSKRKDNDVADSSSSKRRKSAVIDFDNGGTDSLEQNVVKVKTEPIDNSCGEAESGSQPTPVVNIKTEPAEHNEVIITTERAENENATTSSATEIDQRNVDSSGITIKTELIQSNQQSCSSSAIKVESVDAAESGGSTTSVANANDNVQSTTDACVSSSTIRPSCRFGIRCYRSNPMHRTTEAHPGDADYRRPSFPAPPLGTPPCPFGNNCYRRNPVHFQQFSHPPDFNSAQNIRSRLRQRRVVKRNSNVMTNSDSEIDDEEPFSGDSDLEYTPGADIDVDDDEDYEDDELEFDSQRVNTDEYD